VTALAGHWRDGADRATVEAATAQLLASAAVLERGGRFTTREADARVRRVAAALDARTAVTGGPDALDALQREGRRVVVITRDDADARLATARAGVAAVAVADALPIVDALGPRDVVVIDPVQRLPSAELERVMAAAARCDAVVRRMGGPLPPPVAAPLEPLAAAAAFAHSPALCPPRTLAVAGGDITTAATPGAASDVALADWLARRRLGQPAVVVAERGEVDALNARARAALRGAALLGPDVNGFATGDVVWFTHARPSIGVARYAQGEVTAASPDAVQVRLARDARVVGLRPAQLRTVVHGHVVPPVPALIAARGDVFVVGGRSFAARHLAGAHLHMYLTAPPAAAVRCPPAHDLTRAREWSLARHPAGRGAGRSR
jgi:hypothetical protein